MQTGNQKYDAGLHAIVFLICRLEIRSRLWFSQCSRSCVSMHFSTSLDINGRFVMGLYFLLIRSRLFLVEV